MIKKAFWIIFVLTIILRFYKLGQVPQGLDWDEVSNSYNAYSILKTSRDEHGNFLPLTNRSFDDYKPPLYMYLEVPSIAVFGLTPFAARLPSALFGVSTVVVIFFLTKLLFRNSQAKEEIALISMFLLAIAPWHIHFSRVGFEANIGLFFTVCAFTLFLYSLLNSKHILFLVSAVLFGLSFYSYHSVRILIPFLFIATLIIFSKELINFSKKYLIIFVLIVVAIVFPFFLLTPGEALSQRFETTTKKARADDIDKSIRFIIQDQEKNIPFPNLIHNRRLVILQTSIANFLSHFDLNFLFTKGDNNFRHHIENMGMLYLVQMPLILYGIYLSIKAKTREHLFLIIWLVLAPIPASFGDTIPHAIRAYPMIIPLTILSALALVDLSTKFQRQNLPKFIFALTSGIFLLAYLHNYYSHHALDSLNWWQFGYLNAAKKSQALQDQYRKVFIDPSIEQGYVFWLFALKFDPKTFQEQGDRNHFGKYVFSNEKPIVEDELFIATSVNFPQQFQVIETINYPSGKENIKIGHPK